MAQFFRLRSRFLAAGLIVAAMAGFSGISAVLAEQTLTSTEQPLQVRLSTTLNAETAHYGDHFEGILTDSYQMGGKSLPEGTIFKGQVQRARKSLPFGMPGYVVLEIDEAQLPSGVVHHFEHQGSAPKSSRITNPQARNGKKLFRDNLPFTVASTATSIPLTYATGLGSGIVLPITLGSRVALGVAMQLAHKVHPGTAQAQPAPTSLGTSVKQGVLQGSGLNTAYYFLTAAPEPVLTEGSVIPLHFKSQDLIDLFDAGEATAAQAESEPQPAKAKRTHFGRTNSSPLNGQVSPTPAQGADAAPTSDNVNLMAQPGQ
jgi:hypothetical protein